MEYIRVLPARGDRLLIRPIGQRGKEEKGRNAHGMWGYEHEQDTRGHGAVDWESSASVS